MSSGPASPPRPRRERSFAHNDSTLNESPYQTKRNRSRERNDSGGYTPTLITRAPRRERTFYKASNFRDNSPGTREKSGATNRSTAPESVRTVGSNHSGSRITREGSFIRLDYNEQNKLAFRRLVKPEPPVQFVRNREKSFVNDAIVTTNQRTKYKDTLLTPYDALNDIHCKAYIKRPDVQRLLNETCTVKPGERDIKRKYLEQEDYYNSLY